MSGLQPEDYTINYYIKNYNDLFQVTVASNETVSALATKIWDQHPQSLRLLDVTAIKLYHVNIDVVESSESTREKLQKFELSPQSMPLHRLENLTKVFKTSGLPEMTVHIFILPPSVIADPFPRLDSRQFEAAQIRAISSLDACIKPYLDNNMQLPQWRSKSQNPDLRHFIDTLNIPKVSDYAPPSLLLHTLGESSDSSLLDHIHQLFRDGNRYLVNTSGSGKTRLLLEGLCHHWGFYFTVNNQPDEVGSRDISRMLQTMRGLLPVAGSRNRFETVENNREILSRHFLPVLYIRVLALRLFLKHASQMEGGIQEEHKRRWLLLQLASPYFTGYDLLSVVSVFFQGDFAGDLNAAITEELAQIQTMLGGPRFRLFTVIDEAQGIANTYMDFFRSEVKPDKPRPILSEILTLWLIPSMNYIISGTGLSQKLLEGTLSSRVGKIVVQETVHDLGAFDRGVPHVEYLKRYFPPRLLESPKWEPLLSRLLYWLCGRYRFTASYIELLIQDNFDAPDGLLDQYAYALTGLRLSNSADFEDDYMDDGERYVLNLYGFDLSKLAKDEALMRQLAGLLFDYIFSGQSRNLLGPDNEALIQHGIARFKDEKNITTDEPLALLEAAKFLSTQPEWNLFYFITETLGRSYNKAARGIAVEHAGAYLLCLAFTQPRQLSEVFEFATDHPLKYEVAQLVALQRNAADLTIFPLTSHQGRSPTTFLGA